MAVAPMMFRPLAGWMASLPRRTTCSRRFSVLSTNPHINVFRLATLPPSYLLTLLDSTPPCPSTALGTATALPPTPRTFTANPRFLALLNDVMRAHAADDKDLQAQALALAGPGGAIFSRGDGDAHQGGSGGGGVGGWVHLSDTRNPPDYGRIAWPEDILGSVEVDGRGHIVGAFQPSGTYRLLTNEGVLGLSDFLRGKLVERLRAEEAEDPSRAEVE